MFALTFTNTVGVVLPPKRIKLVLEDGKLVRSLFWGQTGLHGTVGVVVLAVFVAVNLENVQVVLQLSLEVFLNR